MRRLSLGVLLLVFLLGWVAGCSTPTEDISDKARTRPRLLKPGDVKNPGPKISPP
jgi:hypothetical protein